MKINEMIENYELCFWGRLPVSGTFAGEWDVCQWVGRFAGEFVKPDDLQVTYKWLTSDLVSPSGLISQGEHPSILSKM